MLTSNLFVYSSTIQLTAIITKGTEMNYNRLYDNIIQNAQARAVTEGYTETHHILPRSMGGADVASNLVVLTAREHYLAHYCLAKFTTGKDKASMVFAFNCMNNVNPTGKRYINSRLFESLRIECARLISASLKGHKVSKETKKKIGDKAKGRLVSKETRRKISKATKGKNNPRYGVKLSKEECKKMSDCQKGSKSHFYGKKHSLKTLTKMKNNNSMKNNPICRLKSQIKHAEKGLDKVKGYRKQSGKYLVRMSYKGKGITLGTYATEAEASKVAFRERLKYLGALKAELKELQI